jgi:hypothetical protein
VQNTDPYDIKLRSSTLELITPCWSSRVLASHIPLRRHPIQTSLSQLLAQRNMMYTLSMAKSFWISILLSERSHNKNILCSVRVYSILPSSIDLLSCVLPYPRLPVLPYSPVCFPPVSCQCVLLLVPVFAQCNKQASHLQDFRHYWLYDLLRSMHRRYWISGSGGACTSLSRPNTQFLC